MAACSLGWQRQGRVGAAVQVAERALFLWNNEAVVSLAAQHRADVRPPAGSRTV